MFTVPDAGGLQGTPVVVDGIMYVTAPNECYRARRRQRTADLALQAAAHEGRRAAATRIAARRWPAIACSWSPTTRTSSRSIASPASSCGTASSTTGARTTRLRPRRYPAGNLVISGVSGGEHGANGFVAAHDQETGKEVWRFWTVPKPGEPGSETWQGKDIEHGGAPTWFTGSYDAALDTRLLADRQSRQGIQRRRSPGRQPLREFDRSRSTARPAS